MALNMHLKLEGGSVTFEGESKQAGHEKEVEVLAWSWGASQSGSFAHGAGGAAGKVNMQDISITKYIDKSSTAFLKALVGGDHIGDVTLAISKVGNGKQNNDYWKMKLSPAMVTSYSTGGSGGEDLLTENISLGFAKFEIEYFMQDDTGAVSSAGTISYDVATGDIA